MADHYEALNCLPNCFCLERKHKSPKRFAELIRNTACNWNIGVLRDVTANHLHSLWEADAECFGIDPGLLMPREPRPQLRSALQRELGIPGDVRYSTATRARCNEFECFSVGDAVLVRDAEGEITIGQVRLLVGISAQRQSCSVAILNKWRVVTETGGTFKCLVTDEFAYCNVEDVAGALLWADDGRGRTVVQPFRF